MEGEVAGGRFEVFGRARIDNRDELVAKVGASLPESRAPADDLSLLVASYRQRSLAGLTDSVGDFAVVVVDRERARAVAIRDHAGAQPLFYAADATGGIILGSDIGEVAARAGKAVPDLSEQFLAHALVGDFSNQLLTPYLGVQRVPPGHLLSWGIGDRPLTPRAWWSAPEVDPELAEAPFDELAQSLGSLLAVAVRDRVAAGHRVGAQLTGGLDSSAVCALAASTQPEATAALLGLRSYFADPSEHGRNARLEAPYLDAVVGRYGLRHSMVMDSGELTGSSLSHHGAGSAYPHSLAPFPHTLPAAWLRLNEAMATDGVQLALSGWGGDQLASYSGSGHAAGLLMNRRFVAFRRALTSAPARGGGYRGFLRQEVASYLVAERRERRAIGDLAAMCDPGFVARTGLRDLRGGMRRGPSPEVNRRRMLDGGYLGKRIELDQWAAADHGVSYTYPLLDRRVVEWCLRVPATAWVRDGRGRALFREAMRPRLPSIVVDRSGKNAPDPEWSTVVTRDAARKRQVFEAAVHDPVVAALLPGLTAASAGRLDLARRNRLEAVCLFVAQHSLRHH
jgi:asparagine synthase (glutamine-hydrolysing)